MRAELINRYEREPYKIDEISEDLGLTDPVYSQAKLIQILDQYGLYDALWCLRFFPEHSGLWRKYAVWCAREVQHLMTDERSIAALDVAWRYSNGKATDEELAAARESALKAANNISTEAALSNDRDFVIDAKWAAARAALRTVECDNEMWKVAWDAAWAIGWEAAGKSSDNGNWEYDSDAAMADAAKKQEEKLRETLDYAIETERERDRIKLKKSKNYKPRSKPKQYDRNVVITKLVFDGYSYVKTALLFDMSVERVRQIFYQTCRAANMVGYKSLSSHKKDSLIKNKDLFIPYLYIPKRNTKANQ